MKKITALFISVMMVVALAVPVFAEGAYVESITAKPAPEVVGDGGVIGEVVGDGSEAGSIGEGDLIITPFVDRDKLDDEARRNIEEAFDKIKSGEASYPEVMKELLGNNPVAKDLFYVEAVGAGLLEDLTNGKEIRFTLNVGIGAGEPVVVATYVDGEWVVATETVNNGDGTITVTLSKLGTVGVFVKGEDATEPSVTPEPGEPVDGDGVGEGNCKICHTFFPYLGTAPIINGVCIICFVLIVIAICVVTYIIYRFTKKDEDEDKKA